MNLLSYVTVFGHALRIVPCGFNISYVTSYDYMRIFLVIYFLGITRIKIVFLEASAYTMFTINDFSKAAVPM
jgi:hypothetical protein